MANPEHLAILKKGADAWDRWRAKHPTEAPDLSGAVISQAELRMSDLSLPGIGLAHVFKVDLRCANLSGADLSRTVLSGADLSGADLRGSNLSEASLFKADLSRVSLCGANLGGAKTDQTIFSEVDLSEAIGLESVRHDGPSSIGIDTIYKSKGRILHVFLRGAGVPENFIKYMASLVGTGIEFYSLFISYSTHDQEFAERLHSDLQAKGVRCWFAPHNVKGGKKLHEQIDEAIRLYDKLLLILSPASMESEWVKTEISKARKREVREGKRVLFPIRLCSFEALRDWECFDADAGKDSAREIREYFIPDFSNWKDHDSYKLAFDKLLDDLHGKPDSSAA